jgi:hypothetical protein
MLRDQMTLEEVYRNRDLIEASGKCIYYFSSKSGQWHKLRFAASQELHYGKNYPVLIERKDGQILRSYLSSTEVVRVATELEVKRSGWEAPA